MLCNVAQTIVRRVFTCSMLSQEFYGNIAQELSLCNRFSWPSRTILRGVFITTMLFQEHYYNIAQNFFRCNVVGSLSDNIVQGFSMCNVVPEVLKQYTWFISAQCCLEPPGQHCVDIIDNRFTFRTLLTWLFSMKSIK